MKRVALMAFALVAIVAMSLATSAPAKADSVDFNIVNGGTWSWAGTGTTLTATITSATGTIQVSRTGGSPLGPFTLANATLTWTSGTFASGTGTGPFNWNSGGTITVSTSATQTVNGVSVGAGTLFSGTFTAPETLTNGGGGIASFVGNFVGGNLGSAALMQALGFGATPSGATGLLTANLVGTASAASGGSGTISSGDLTLATPEPGSIMLLGTGLFGLAGIIRRKLNA